MPITVYSNVLLPNSILSAGISGKQLRLNSRVQTDNGFESVNVIWSQTIRQYTLGTVPLRVDQWQALETLHEITEGGAFGFLMEDPKDRTVTNGVMQQPGTDPTVMQLYKRYQEPHSLRHKERKITRPRAATVQIKDNGVLLNPGAYTINEETGIVTFSVEKNPLLLSWTGNFYVPVHFLDDSIDWALEIAGQADGRFLAGPSVVLQEVRE